MKLHFPRNAEGSTRRARVTGTALPTIPPDVLDRHGARVLRPSEALRRPGAPAPATTVYRYGVLLVPDETTAAPSLAAALPALNTALAPIGLALTHPAPAQAAREPGAATSTTRPAVDPTLPRPVALVPAERAGPVAVDAWAALQALGAAAERGLVPGDLVERISLDHLLVGANMATEGSGDPTSLFLGTPQAGLAGRVPVQVVLPRPTRRTLAELGVRRRPVVAVLDTGIAAHPWLDIVDRSTTAPGDEFVVVDGALQRRIHDLDVANAGAEPGAILDGYLDRPAVAQPLTGELDTHAGHGTFIAGLVRQVAPDARVLAVRVMHPDGIAYESDLLLALSLLTEQMRRVRDGQPDALPIDVVSLSLGYFDETDATREGTRLLRRAIDALTATGVTVVASAGNYATSRPFYPAALAGRPAPSGHAPTIAVGALNPNGSVARFSDEADWVTVYAPGVALLSTFPEVAGSVNPAESVNGAGPRRETFDPDDFTSGFALWSGTSFAGPVVAAELAGALLANAMAEPDRLGLSNHSASSTVDRAWQAWAAVQKRAG